MPKRKFPFPDATLYTDKQPIAAAWIILHSSDLFKDTTREDALFVWAGKVGTTPNPVLRQLLQHLDQADDAKDSTS